MASDEEDGTGVLGALVLVSGEAVGRVTAAVTDPAHERLLGLEVTGALRGRRFLPWIAATLDGGVVHAASSLVLFDADEVGAYVRRGARLVEDSEEIARLAARSAQPGVSPELAAGTGSA